MGYMFATGPCIACGQLFSFNPELVPSSSAVTGKREPICLPCVDRINPQRIAKGLEPIVPLPGAYEPTEVDHSGRYADEMPERDFFEGDSPDY